MKSQYIKTILLLLCSALLNHAAFAQDSAVFNAANGTWRLFYEDPDTKQWVQKDYIMRNAIAPRVQSTVRWNGSSFNYEYRVSNQRHAKQAIAIFRVWGIPLIYDVPNLPPITADIATDNLTWGKQFDAQLDVKDEFSKKTLKAPSTWRAKLRTDEEVNQTSFVFTPGWKDTDPDGVMPGLSQSGFRAIRPELPGVTTTEMMGSTKEPWGLDGVPDTPFWDAKVAEIRALDYLTVPVLAPIIVIPQPYNGAELAKRIKDHAATWVKNSVVTQNALDRLNRDFDALIAAQTMNNLAGTHAAVRDILQEAYGHHRGLNHNKQEQDDDEHDATPVVRKTPAREPINRLAARSLSFNLTYLLTRAYIRK